MRSTIFAVGFGPILVLGMALVIKIPFDQAVSFGLCYYWMALVYHPNVEHRASTKQYRFSFVRLVFVLDKGMRQLATKVPPIRFSTLITVPLRWVPPLALVTSMYLASNRGSIALAILGCALYVFLDFGERQLVLRKSLKKFPKKRESGGPQE